jgi:hypothetical protein
MARRDDRGRLDVGGHAEELLRLRIAVLVDRGDAAAKHAEAYKRLVQLLDDEVPVVTTGLGDAAVGWRAPAKGFEPHVIGLLAYPGGG